MHQKKAARPPASMGTKRGFACDEPGCQWGAGTNTRKARLDDHKRAKHGADFLRCVDPGCAFESAWQSSLSKHQKRADHGGPALPPTARDKLADAKAEGDEMLGEPSVDEGGDTEELASEPDLEAELDAAKQEAALAHGQLKRYKHALRREKGRTASLRSELAAAEAAAQAAVTAAAKAGQAMAEVATMAEAQTRELRVAQSQAGAAEARVAAMEARAVANAADARTFAAQARADAALAFAKTM
jgi:hypothetical protein